MAVVFTAGLATSFLLFALYHVSRSWPMLLLGHAYLFGAMLAVLHLPTFPGAILEGRSVQQRNLLPVRSITG